MTDTDDVYQFEFVSIDGERLPLDAWRGRPVLVVNTASFCGYTPQYSDLEALWQRYRDRGLVVLGVPSNDFGRQEPGSTGQIKEFCTTNYTDLRIFPDVSVLSIAGPGSVTAPTERAKPKPRRPRRASGPGRGCWQTGSRPSRRHP